MAGYVYAWSAAQQCEQLSAAATTAAMTFPLLPPPTADLSQIPEATLLLNASAGDFTVEAEFFYALGARLPAPAPASASLSASDRYSILGGQPEPASGRATGAGARVRAAADRPGADSAAGGTPTGGAGRHPRCDPDPRPAWLPARRGRPSRAAGAGMAERGRSGLAGWRCRTPMARSGRRCWRRPRQRTPRTCAWSPARSPASTTRAEPVRDGDRAAAGEPARQHWPQRRHRHPARQRHRQRSGGNSSPRTRSTSPPSSSRQGRSSTPATRSPCSSATCRGSTPSPRAHQPSSRPRPPICRCSTVTASTLWPASWSSTGTPTASPTSSASPRPATRRRWRPWPRCSRARTRPSCGCARRSTILNDLAQVTAGLTAGANAAALAVLDHRGAVRPRLHLQGVDHGARRGRLRLRAHRHRRPPVGEPDLDQRRRHAHPPGHHPDAVPPGQREAACATASRRPNSPRSGPSSTCTNCCRPARLDLRAAAGRFGQLRVAAATTARRPRPA